MNEGVAAELLDRYTLVAGDWGWIALDDDDEEWEDSE